MSKCREISSLKSRWFEIQRLPTPYGRTLYYFLIQLVSLTAYLKYRYKTRYINYKNAIYVYYLLTCIKQAKAYCYYY
jgi:hypothetical protein